jgi:hypothetical protein
MHANNFFFIFKNYFWHQHIKTIQNIQIIFNFNKKKISNFLGTQPQPRSLGVMINLLQNFMLWLILTGPNNLYWDLPNILFGLGKQDHKGSYLSEKSNLSWFLKYLSPTNINHLLVTYDRFGRLSVFVQVMKSIG